MFPVMTESPFMRGYLQGMQGRNLKAEAQTKEEQLKTLPEMLQAQLLAEQEKARGMGITNEFLPSTLQSEIALRQAQIPLLGAQTGHYNMMTNLMPGDQAIAAQNAATAQGRLLQSQNRFDNVYKFNQFIKTPAGQDFASKNPQIAEAILRVGAGTGTLADEQILNQLNFGEEGAQGSQQPRSVLGIAQQIQNNGMTPQQQANQAYGITPEAVKSVQNAIQSTLIKDTVPTQVQQQRYYDKSLENMFTKLDNKIEKATQFSGLKGQAELYGDKLLTGLGGPTSEKYQNYLQAQKLLDGVANELGRSLGNHATNEQLKMLHDLSNPITFYDNPQTSMIKYNALKEMARANAEAIAQTGSEINWNLQNQKNSSSLATPSFKSQQDAINWYKNATPEQKAAYRAQRSK